MDQVVAGGLGINRVNHEPTKLRMGSFTGHVTFYGTLPMPSLRSVLQLHLAGSEALVLQMGPVKNPTLNLRAYFVRASQTKSPCETTISTTSVKPEHLPFVGSTQNEQCHPKSTMC